MMKPDMKPADAPEKDMKQMPSDDEMQKMMRDHGDKVATMHKKMK